MDEDAFERKLYVVRKCAENEVEESGIEDAETFTFLRSRAGTIVYKGLLLAPQITNFYRELSDPDVMSALCLVHQALLDQHFSQLATGASFTDMSPITARSTLSAAM